MAWVWYFMAYSFLGFLLEVVFFRVSGGRPDRKGLLVLPLCPVYGLGACASLRLAPLSGGNPAMMFLLGMAACTAAEYGMAVCYGWMGVSFWNYSGRAGNIQGRICLPFSMLWGALVLGQIYVVHPALARLVSGIPASVTVVALATLLSDAVASTLLLWRTGDRACLRWYEAFTKRRTDVTADC